MTWKREAQDIAMTIGFLFAVAFICYALGFISGIHAVKDEAIRHGSAMESVDPESGEMRFEWK